MPFLPRMFWIVSLKSLSIKYENVTLMKTFFLVEFKIKVFEDSIIQGHNVANRSYRKCKNKSLKRMNSMAAVQQMKP